MVSSPVAANVTESSAVMTIIPASRLDILNLTCKIPVTEPTANPEMKLRIIAGSAGIPSLSISTVQKTPPSGNVPSTERSGKSSIVYEMYTPSASIAKHSPICRPSIVVAKI